MSKLVRASILNYSTLLAAIRQTIAAGRAVIEQTQAQTYWQVGRYISEYILKGEDRAKYGEHVFEKLSADLKIEAKTLRDTARFAREFPIWNARSKLPWTHVRSLLSLPNPSDRELLIQKSLKQNWSTRKLNTEVQKLKKKTTILSTGPIIKLKVERGRLFTYPIIKPPTLNAGHQGKFIDCGFSCFRFFSSAALGRFKEGEVVSSIKKVTTSPGHKDTSHTTHDTRVDVVTSPGHQDTRGQAHDPRAEYQIEKSKESKNALYTFKATIERIVDGDTVIAVIDLGFNLWTRQYLRFRQINCPELTTKEGKRVKRFIEERLKLNQFVIIKTHKDDKYGRYLVDIWYAPIEKDKASLWDATRVAADGIYLNQELLDARLAVRS